MKAVESSEEDVMGSVLEPKAHNLTESTKECVWWERNARAAVTKTSQHTNRSEKGPGISDYLGPAIYAVHYLLYRT